MNDETIIENQNFTKIYVSLYYLKELKLTIGM